MAKAQVSPSHDYADIILNGSVMDQWWIINKMNTWFHVNSVVHLNDMQRSQKKNIYDKMLYVWVCFTLFLIDCYFDQQLSTRKHRKDFTLQQHWATSSNVHCHKLDKYVFYNKFRHLWFKLHITSYNTRQQRSWKQGCNVFCNLCQL